MHITKAIVSLSLALVSGAAFAQSEAISTGKADSASMAQTGAITFHSSDPLRHSSVSTTPPVYVAPSMMAPGTCGMSDTASVSVTGFGIGGSKSHESTYCNSRQDTSTAWNLGYQDVAAMRFFCFGTDENRMAFEASGYRCPATATAKGIEPQRAVAGYQGNDPIVLQRLAGK
jgi:hypothetical protein